MSSNTSDMPGTVRRGSSLCTFKCTDGWVYVAALGGPIYDRVPGFLGLDPVEYSYDASSKDAAAVNSEKGRDLDRRLREYCAARTALEVETELNAAKIGCARVFNTRDQYEDAHYAAREMTVPVLDRQSGVPIRVYGVVPKNVADPWADLARRAVDRGRHDRHSRARWASPRGPSTNYTPTGSCTAPNPSPNRRSRPSTRRRSQTAAQGREAAHPHAAPLDDREMAVPIVARRDPGSKALSRRIGAWRRNTQEHYPTAGL